MQRHRLLTFKKSNTQCIFLLVVAKRIAKFWDLVAATSFLGVQTLSDTYIFHSTWNRHESFNKRMPLVAVKFGYICFSSLITSYQIDLAFHRCFVFLAIPLELSFIDSKFFILALFKIFRLYGNLKYVIQVKTCYFKNSKAKHTQEAYYKREGEWETQ